MSAALRCTREVFHHADWYCQDCHATGDGENPREEVRCTAKLHAARERHTVVVETFTRTTYEGASMTIARRSVVDIYRNLRTYRIARDEACQRGDMAELLRLLDWWRFIFKSPTQLDDLLEERHTMTKENR